MSPNFVNCPFDEKCKYCVQKKWSVPIRQQSSSQVRQLLYNRLTTATQFVTAFQFTSTA